MDQLSKESFIRASQYRLVVEMGRPSSIRHCRNLEAVCIKKLLQGFLTAHMVPVAIQLGCEVMEMPDVPKLFSIELRVLGEIEVQHGHDLSQSQGSFHV